MWAEQQSGARIGNYSERRACNLICAPGVQSHLDGLGRVLLPEWEETGEISATGERPAKMVGTYWPLLGPCGVRSDVWPVFWPVFRD